MLTRKDDKSLFPWLVIAGKAVPNQAPMNVDDFRREVRCAYQLLNLVADIRDERIGAVHDAFDQAVRGMGVLITTLDQNLVGIAKGREALANTPQQKASWVSDPDRLTIFLATKALMGTLQTKLSGVQLGFGDQVFVGPEPKGSDFRPTKGWYCPDLLAAIYLQLYLWLTDNRALRRCRFCGNPFPITRSDKVYCSKNHVVQARQYLKKGETFPADR
jgi:hypothetical protein